MPLQNIQKGSSNKLKKLVNCKKMWETLSNIVLNKAFCKTICILKVKMGCADSTDNVSVHKTRGRKT